MADEIRDYKRKDSLEIARKDPRYMDSIDKKRNKINPFMALLFEQRLTFQRSRTTFSFRPLTELIAFNPAEGWVINPDVTWTKDWIQLLSAGKVLLYLRYSAMDLPTNILMRIWVWCISLEKIFFCH